MARGRGGAASSGEDAEKYKNAKDAKELLDKIGQQVYNEKVKKGVAETYKGELKGNLASSTFFVRETVSSLDPCELDYTKRLNGKRYPCANRSPVRFSDENRSQCTFNRIKDSQERDNDVGACAPFRRLSVCDYNLEKMGTKKIKATHNLLAEVCLAAKYEAESLEKYRDLYEAKYHDFGSTICTVLARSFADIGDIIRGKDLYLGNPQEKKQREQLDDNLKKYFQQIHDDVTSTKGRSASPLQARYQDTKGDFFQLREDWWYANRNDVWKAMTCEAPESAKYFRQTCGSNENTATQAKNKCRCGDGKKPDDQVPTYFDYVPQYLRWFEEWAEDFCRKRKHKLENAITNCRGKDGSGEERYCSRNGYDCKKTVRGKNILVSDPECTNCSVVCTPFVDWIDNKKLEFEKQKNKYDKEIQKKEDKTTTTITIGDKTINNLYVGDFYKILHEYYPKVDKFLEKLNKEGICEKQPQASGETADAADFSGQNYVKTFDHTEYCETCPWCATKKKGNDGKWTENPHGLCTDEQNNDFDDKKTTEINLLDKDKDGTNIVEKLKSLCNTPFKRTIQKWKCRFESSEKHYCVLQDDNKDNPQKRTIHSFNSLFWRWVTEMLKDSIDWSKELNSCINNNSANCISKKCNKDCECFEKWVGQKEQEWQQVLDVYDKQPDFNGVPPYGALEWNLQNDYLEMIQKYYRQEKPVEEIKKIIEKNKQNVGNCKKDNNSITKFLQQEKEIATECKKIQEECKKKKQQRQKQANENLARSAVNPPRVPTAGTSSQPGTTPPVEHVPVGDNDNHSDEDSDEEDDDVDKNVEAEGSEEPEPAVDVQEGSEATDQDLPEVKKDDVNVCDTVKSALAEDNLTQACQQKYGKNAPSSWKCIPTEKTNAATGAAVTTTTKPGESGEKSGSSGTNQGATCIPPRRRKLYIGGLTKWANNSGNTQVVSGTVGNVATVDGVSTSPQVALLHAFIQSAAIETFFLWHKYKQEKKKPQGEAAALAFEGDEEDTAIEPDPEEELKGGTIPDDFKRQMFYTFGDYRDICLGKDIGNDVDEIEKKIKDVFTNGDAKDDQKRKNFWDKYGKDIWDGMVCALSYDTETQEKFESVHKNLMSTEKKNNYKSVTFPLKSGPSSGISLSDFAKKPQFIRWFEEWAEEFCRKRTYKLKKAKQECRGKEEGDKYCDGDGYDCTDKDKLRNESFIYLQCSDCQEQCIKYKKWIMNKKNQFNKQKKKFENEINNVDSRNQNKYDEGLYKNPKTMYDSFTHFVERLNKSAYCINSNVGVQIDFNKNGETFGSSEYCKACPVYGVTYNRTLKKYKPIDETTYNKKKVNRGKNENESVPTEIDVLILGRKGEEDDKYDDTDCTNSGIFENSSFEKWKCQKKNGVEQCKLKNYSGDIDDDENMEFNVFFQRWLRYFVHDYNILKDKIKPCLKTKYEKSNKCINGCKGKLECVEKWLNKKSTEWVEIKQHYKKHPKFANVSIPYLVKSYFVEQLYFDKDSTKAKDVVEGEEEQKKLWGCTGDNIDNDDQTKCDKGDFITNLIDKLKIKIATCKTQHDEKKGPCDPFPPVEDSPPEDTSPEDAQKPAFCPEEKVEPPEKPEAPKPEPEPEVVPKKDKTPVKPAPLPPPPPEAPPAAPTKPLPSDNTSDILKTTIPFGIALALGSIAFLFLKVIHIVVYISTNTNITTTSRHTLDQKPFIMSIHDRNLYTGEEYNYSINMVNNDIPMSGKNGTYTGIDLINDTLSGNKHIDIYDEVLKRKENELFGTNYKKNTSNNSPN
ncbi:hypothetical protein PFTANZ_06064 [Plasmodium falciparum Tanzania (2000708)]|uniref:Erythrocyte membrane protein 1 n=1 Tax=Plasmodium falciparum Tanzania (2000708) TaxID=1036725 RepID=A0A024VXN9_PLAFA|nr:hypothetical protein PFTANZ_06064 [Plasmodium falciparum Tanzania (2000708)]